MFFFTIKSYIAFRRDIFMMNSSDVHQSIDVIEAHLTHRLNCENALGECIQGVLRRSQHLRSQNEHLIQTLSEAHIKLADVSTLLKQSRQRHEVAMTDLLASQSSRQALEEELSALKRVIRANEDASKNVQNAENQRRAGALSSSMRALEQDESSARALIETMAEEMVALVKLVLEGQSFIPAAKVKPLPSERTIADDNDAKTENQPQNEKGQRETVSVVPTTQHDPFEDEAVADEEEQLREDVRAERASVQKLQSEVESLTSENQSLKLREEELKGFLLKLESELIAYREHKSKQTTSPPPNGHASAHPPNGIRRASKVSMTSSSTSNLPSATPKVKTFTPPPTAKEPQRSAASTSTTPKMGPLTASPFGTSAIAPTTKRPKTSHPQAHSTSSIPKSVHSHSPSTRGGYPQPPTLAARAASPSNFHYPGAPPPPTSIPKSYVSQVLQGLRKEGSHGSMVDLLATSSQRNRVPPPPPSKPLVAPEGPAGKDSPSELASSAAAAASKAPPPARTPSKSPFRAKDTKIPPQQVTKPTSVGFKKAPVVA